MRVNYAKTVLNVPLIGQVNGTTFGFLSKSSTIYEVLAALSNNIDKYNPQDGFPLKTTYVNTHVAGSGVPSDNLFMPQQALCFKMANFISMVFVGGVIRDSANYYLVAFATY